MPPVCGWLNRDRAPPPPPPPCAEAPQSTSISDCCTLPTSLFIVIRAWGNSNDWWGYVGGWVRHPLLMSTASYVACPEVWSEAMPMTASCLLSMSGFETLLRYERMMPLMWDQAADWLPYQPRLPAYMHPGSNMAEKLTNKWKSQILVSTYSWAGSTNCNIECYTHAIPLLPQPQVYS